MPAFWVRPKRSPLGAVRSVSGVEGQAPGRALAAGPHGPGSASPSTSAIVGVRLVRLNADPPRSDGPVYPALPVRMSLAEAPWRTTTSWSWAAARAGERAAIQAARAGKTVAVVERAHVVGGNRVNWGTIPSKTLRESAVFFYQLTRNRLHGIRYEVGPELTVADFMFRERAVVARELELINESLGRYAVELVQGHARFAGPHAVAVKPPDGGRASARSPPTSSSSRPARAPTGPTTCRSTARRSSTPRRSCSCPACRRR